MTSRLLQLSGMLVVGSTVAACAVPMLDPALGVVFRAENARPLLQQCSRGVPTNVTGTWNPSRSQIAELERQFPAAFVRAVERFPSEERAKLVKDIPNYARQYGGFHAGSRKFIYVNGFLARLIDFDGTDLMKQKMPNWRRKASMVCDGGPSFFGAEYDLDTKLFTTIAFNGVA